MPHLIVHHTANLAGFDPDLALAAANRALIASGHFEPLAIKSRALVLDHFRVGGADNGHGFVHATLHVMPGRSETVRATLGREVHDALASCLPSLGLQCQLCVEVVELQPATYIKTTHAPASCRRSQHE